MSVIDAAIVADCSYSTEIKLNALDDVASSNYQLLPDILGLITCVLPTHLSRWSRVEESPLARALERP